MEKIKDAHKQLIGGNLKRIRKENGMIPSPDQIRAVIDAIPYEDVRVLCTMQLYTGLRPREVKRLRWENYKGDSILLTESKTGEQEIIPIPAIVLPWFKSHQKESGYVFESQRKRGAPYSNLHGILHKAGDKVGVHLTPHLLRHASGTFVYESTEDIYAVQHHLRHAKVTTSQIYTRYSANRRAATQKTLIDYIDNN